MYKVDIEQGSLEWHRGRWSNVTGTSLRSALGTDKNKTTLMYELIAQRMTEVQIDSKASASMDHGIAMEPVAMRAVIAETGIEFTNTGLLLSDDIPYFSISPDGIYEENGVVVGGLEIKCPNSKKHVEYLIKGEIPKEYIHQVRAPFVMSDDVRFWYFASFDDRNYERPLFLTKVERSELNELPSMRSELKAFLSHVNDEYMKLTF